jgi:nucleoside-diphosphate-sugar epimerase
MVFMIYGNGLMARAMQPAAERKDLLIFASGVSDSSCRLASEFDREAGLLKQALSLFPEALVVYFGTCSIYDESMCNSAYVRHKTDMEELVRQNSKNHLICRLANPVGRTTNIRTLINNFADAILNERKIEVWQSATRNIMDVDDICKTVFYLVDELGCRNMTLNIANIKCIGVPELVEILEQVIGRRANKVFLEKGSPLKLEIKEPVLSVYKTLGLFDMENYNLNLLQKYYGN